MRSWTGKPIVSRNFPMTRADAALGTAPSCLRIHRIRRFRCAHRRHMKVIGKFRDTIGFPVQERMMLSYVYFGTNDFERAVRFYDAALAPLGMPRCVTGDPEWDRVAAGWGIYENGGARELGFWIGKPFDQRPATVGNGSMVAFSAH